MYGAGYESVPPGTANPLPLLLPAVALLRDYGHADAAARILTAVEDHGQAEAATRIVAAVEAVLAEGTTRTADLGGTAGTAEFTSAIVDRLSGS